MPNPTNDSMLNDVSDTALWVAVYREWETARPDALFKDPLAGRLAGERGKKIESQMSDSRYVSWSVVIRTWIIDRYIEELISKKSIDTVINLGAGLDTRPYRLPLSTELHWIEVDFPKIIEFKNQSLANENPKCRLERIIQDLSNGAERKKLFSKLNSESKKILVITEGVTPYLSNQDVASLAKDLREQPHFLYWITDYNSPELVKRLISARKKREMKNAPFLFNPPDWNSFFEQSGWRQREIHYIGEEAEKLGRPIPHPWYLNLFLNLFVPSHTKEKFKKMNGYALLEPKSSN